MVLKDNPLDFDLYPVTCRQLSGGRSNLEVLDAIVAGGAKIVQLREKELPERDFFALAKKFRSVTAHAGMTFIVNDRLAICQAVEADGVHLGQDDFPVREAQRLLGPQTVIGVSTHSLDQALKAVKDGADYINVGPIFSTQTKQHAGPPVGIELFEKIRRKVSIPITIMGGITLDNLDQVLAAGADRIAVVSAVTAADDIAATVREFRRRIGNGVIEI